MELLETFLPKESPQRPGISLMLSNAKLSQSSGRLDSQLTTVPDASGSAAAERINRYPMMVSHQGVNDFAAGGGFSSGGLATPSRSGPRNVAFSIEMAAEVSSASSHTGDYRMVGGANSRPEEAVSSRSAGNGNVEAHGQSGSGRLPVRSPITLTAPATATSGALPLSSPMTPHDLFDIHGVTRRRGFADDSDSEYGEDTNII
jgi:hypothetical protein